MSDAPRSGSNIWANRYPRERKGAPSELPPGVLPHFNLTYWYNRNFTEPSGCFASARVSYVRGCETSRPYEYIRGAPCAFRHCFGAESNRPTRRCGTSCPYAGALVPHAPLLRRLRIISFVTIRPRFTPPGEAVPRSIHMARHCRICTFLLLSIRPACILIDRCSLSVVAAGIGRSRFYALFRFLPIAVLAIYVVVDQ